ncbi:hypothetical protein B2G74_00210 [Burkholderia sp. A27]|nr:hypothetical protein B2G74_00210 [Burkholderia sp. A27]
MRPDGLVFKDAIREYVVDGGKPVTLMTSESGANGDRHWRCEPSAMTFTPVAGQDYDVFQEMGRKECWISIRRIDAQGLDEQVKGTVAQKCADSAPTPAQNRKGP